MGRAFHDTLRAAFQEIAKSADGRKRVVVDAGKSVDEVARQVLSAVTAGYGLKA
jgi:thymidylate kinase